MIICIRNILLDESGHLKVADLGLSKVLKYAAQTISEDGIPPLKGSSCKYPPLVILLCYDLFHFFFNPKLCFSFATIVHEMPLLYLQRTGFNAFFICSVLEFGKSLAFTFLLLFERYRGV